MYKRHGSADIQRTCFGIYLLYVLASKHNQYAPLRRRTRSRGHSGVELSSSRQAIQRAFLRSYLGSLSPSLHRSEASFAEKQHADEVTAFSGSYLGLVRRMNLCPTSLQRQLHHHWKLDNYIGILADCQPGLPFWSSSSQTNFTDTGGSEELSLNMTNLSSFRAHIGF